MATADIDICNMALDYCGTRNITALDEKTKEAKKCNMWYDTVRKSLLMNLNASFSIKRARLAQIADFVPIYGYGKAFAFPRDLLQLLNIGSPIDDNLYQIESDGLYCDESIKAVNIRYIADIKDVTEYDAEFCDLFALRLAEKICMPLTNDREQAAYIKQLAQQKYIECSTKYGRDNKIVVINDPKYRKSKIYAENFNCNHPIR